MPECGGKVPLVARDRDEPHQDVAIRRMLLVCFFQEGGRLWRLTARIQRSAVALTRAVCCSGVSAKRSVPAKALAAAMRTTRTGSLSRGAVA